MKEITCSGCGKTVLVSDGWTFKTCPKCHGKSAKASQSRKDIRRLKRKLSEAVKGVDLRQHPRLSNIEVFKKEVCYRSFGKIPFEKVLEKYLEAIETIRRKQTDVTTRNETERKRQETRENKRIFIDAYPCHNEECVRIRRLWINKGKNPDDSFTVDSHLVKCDSCARWRIFDRENVSEENDSSDGFGNLDYKPVGANIFSGDSQEKESYEDRARRIQRESNMNPDFKRSTDEPNDRDVERSDFDDKKPCNKNKKQ